MAALGYYVYSRRLRYEEKKLEALPPKHGHERRINA